jgi:DNA-binding XRE family transcriptional regulator
MAKKFYTVSEAAKKLRVTRATLHKAIEAGRLSATWTTISQTIQKRARVISAASLSAFKVDKDQQKRGKKN